MGIKKISKIIWGLLMEMERWGDSGVIFACDIWIKVPIAGSQLNFQDPTDLVHDIQ